MKQLYVTVFCLFSFYVGWTQTTDLSASIEATDLSGTPISNIVLFQEFYYVTTISNSGNDVSNATFSQQFAPNVEALTFESLNAVGGAVDATNFVYDGNTGVATALLPNLPTASSVQIRILVRAPKTSGGISTTATITPPDGTTDTSLDGNTSIISMDVTYVPLDFTVSYLQVNPTSGTGISAWGDQVTFEFTITNNSTIQYPIDDFNLLQGLASNSVNGNTILRLLSLQCIGSTNGANCPGDFGPLPGPPFIITPLTTVYTYGQEIIFPAQSSLTFSAVFEYNEGDCGLESELIVAQSFAEINLAEANTASNQSNIEITDLVDSTVCPCTDVSIATEQIDPLPAGVLSDWNQQVTYQTTLTNSGPLDTTIQFFLQNLGISFDFISITCVSATGGVDCADINFDIGNQFWVVEDFPIPAGATIIIETVVQYMEPDCPTDTVIDSPFRSTVNMLEHVDCAPGDNNEFNTITLPQSMGTDDCVSPDSVSISKTQVSPALPLGSSEDNPIPWGDITYHITINNNNPNDVPLILSDYYGGNSVATGTLQSVTCIETTGTAACIPIPNANIGVELTAIDEVFWEITEAENWILPAQSSITFEVVVNWNPQCSSLVVPVTNAATLNIVGVGAAQTVTETSYLTSCVDLIIQTYPSQATTPINSNFDWIVDITNSITSSTATDAIFTTTVNNAFTITGTPTCTVTSGNATCITTFNVDTTTNEVSGIIPLLDPDATIQIIIPVTAPNFGGSFTNVAEVQPDPANNAESDPSTNISISSVQVLSPSVTKTFTPDEIIATETSLLTFTIENVPGNLAQSGISFTDNLPAGIVLAGDPYWVQSNGATADFVGLTNDDFVGIANLVIPDGVANCTFAVLVTSAVSDLYTNEFANFSNLNNVDASSVLATLNVLPLPPSADLEISLTPNQTEYCEGDDAIFTLTITNNGPDDVENVAVEHYLNTPGFTYVSDNAGGTYTAATGMWELSGISIASAAGSNTFTAEITTTILNVDNSANQYETTAEITATNIIDLDSDVNTSFDVDDLGDSLADDDEIQLQIAVFEIHNDVDLAIENTEVCIGDTTMLVINNPIMTYTYNWYEASNPTQIVFTGTTFETGAVTTDTTYEIEIINENNCPGIAREIVEVTAVSCVDLGIEKVVDIDMPSIGETIQFTITITNNSSEDATNVIIEELLPNGYQYVSHVASNGMYDPNTQLWSITALTAGSSATLTLTVIVVDGDDYSNIVQIIDQAATDINLANNSATAVTFPDCLEIPSGFSPNDDGVNDVWEIACLDNYTDNEVVIFNRWGTIVYKTRNYTNNWNGEANQNVVLFNKNERLPVGTYFYVLKLQGNTIEKTGWIYLNY
ncbi:gliding motility-associated C-terminal domain-containing protein [uncultured Kordia sp.]|uniref:T9SS type B sorting domain-containing protein n=1 Tax=uncultured Kordia sp. TaxID=507699 RepID=UPI00261538CD|nr:gliding motility-associated C-terminal domain-containing protein [uncultured Kordia sp.]